MHRSRLKSGYSIRGKRLKQRQSQGTIFARRHCMQKTYTPSATSIKANVKHVQEAFHKHTLIKIRKTNGQIVGPGYIAIMYGEVAFRLYSEPVSHGSHFFRIEEIAELLPAHEGY